tara:strand:- start:946 stop:2232 length:1287 start_codon:yes stop_codon:yes gene_type:complete
MSFKGKNNLGSRETFFSRSLYNCYAFTEDGTENVIPRLTENFYFLERLFRGRTNQYFYVISPKYSKTKSISEGPTAPALVLDFVADAFKKLQKEFIYAFDREEITPETFIGNPRVGLPVQKASHNIENDYKMHVENINAAFLNSYINDSIRPQIRSFETFFPFYMDYIKTVATNLPCFRGAYITSALNSPINSGLCIEIASYDHASDKEKYDLFIQDKNFEFYKVMAAKHGFVVDKNAPWRLVTDFNPVMVGYANNRNSRLETIDDILASYYDMVYDNEFEDFILMATRTYNAFARSNPVIYHKTRENGCKTTTVIAPPLENASAIQKRFNNYFWLEHYIVIKNIESKLEYPPATLNKIIKNARELEKTFDTRKSLGYIERKFNEFMHREGSLFYETAKRNMKDQGKNPVSLLDDVKRAVRATKTKVY